MGTPWKTKQKTTETCVYIYIYIWKSLLCASHLQSSKSTCALLTQLFELWLDLSPLSLIFSSIPPLSFDLAGVLNWNFVLTFTLFSNVLIRTNCAPPCKSFLCLSRIVKAEVNLLPEVKCESSVGPSLVCFLILSERITSSFAAKILV